MKFILVALFILLDFITGLIARCINGNYQSVVARQGLYHKVGSILCIVFAILCDYRQNYIDIGITIPITISVIMYICLMERGSILENIEKINPELNLKFFNFLKGDDRDD